MAANRHPRRRERWRHLAWATLVTTVLCFFSIAWPLDQLVWAMQARSVSFEPSGQIVFVGSETDLADPDFPLRRENLARVLHNLKEAGVSRVYIDEAFERPSRASSDGRLNAALRAFGEAYLVSNLTTGLDRRLGFERSTSAVASGVSVVGGDRKRVLFGIVWDVPTIVEHQGTGLTNVALSLAERPFADPGKTVPINYSFDSQAIPSFHLGELDGDGIDAAIAGQLAGKRVVIGNVNSANSVNLPGEVDVPQALVHIYAAETVEAGFASIRDLTVLFGTCAVLLAIIFVRAPRTRHWLYLAGALGFPLLVVIAAFFGCRASVGAGLILYMSYGACRLRSKWKEQLLLVDQATNLPTFAALEADTFVSKTAPAIITAKIHRFEEVRKTLPAELHSTYVLRIIERLKAASPDTQIYVGPSHLLAWCMPERNPQPLTEHLEGLRALFGAPLQVGSQQVDVGITFGVDHSPSADVVKRLANAVLAAERSNETYEPIVLAEIDSDEEMLWNISLQARIDQALEKGEIFLNYQPKVLIATGEMIGVEALVRWRDPIKGMIAPDSFIRQCEQTGRMGQMTRHVLREACHAGNCLNAGGAPITVAVNISATMLHNRAIVAMVREVLLETGFDSHLLMLEITETYRISDFAVAAQVLGELMALGARISMDDFGVGAASLEALFELPVAEIKIDRLFVSHMANDPKALAIVKSVISLGQQLRAAVVAEGVEDRATLDLLRKHGCTVAQGYGIQRPAGLEDVVLFRDEWSERRMLRES